MGVTLHVASWAGVDLSFDGKGVEAVAEAAQGLLGVNVTVDQAVAQGFACKSLKFDRKNLPNSQALLAAFVDALNSIGAKFAPHGKGLKLVSATGALPCPSD
ncbi:MAG: hypothetical protein R3B72_27685 [Polyangiaceae bacterium]